MAEGSNTNLLVMHFPFLYIEPHITIDESPRHVSFAGKRELAMNSGHTVASLLPQAVACSPCLQSSTIQELVTRTHADAIATKLEDVFLNTSHVYCCS